MTLRDKFDNFLDGFEHMFCAILYFSVVICVIALFASPFFDAKKYDYNYTQLEVVVLEKIPDDDSGYYVIFETNDGLKEKMHISELNITDFVVGEKISVEKTEKIRKKTNERVRYWYSYC